MKLLLLVPALFLLFSCKKDNTLVVTFDHSNGISVGVPVILKEIQIGEVKSIKMNETYNINIEIKLNDDIQLPNDSKFTIGTKDLFTKAIHIEPGKSKVYLTKSDKIEGETIDNSLNIDALIDVVTDQINNSKLIRNQDSIISNLKEINKELKTINEKIK